MVTKCLVVAAALLVAVRSASLNAGRIIPVEVVYDRPEDEPQSSVAKRNLQERNQLLQEASSNPAVTEQARQEGGSVQSQEVVESNDIEAHLLKGNLNLMEKIQVAPGENLKGLAAEKIVTPDEESQTKRPMLGQIQEIIYNGAENIRKEVEQYLSANKGQGTINDNVWRDLNASLENFVSSLATKQQPSQNTTFFQNLISQFQTFGETFVQNLRPNATESDEQSPGGGFGQNIITFFQNGFQQITGNLSSISPQGTVLGDEASNQPSNPISGFITQVQNFFGQNPIQNLQGNQSDEATSQRPGLGQAFQNAANQIGQAISNSNPFRPSTQAPGAEGDEQQPQGPQQIFQNAISNFGQAISNANPFRPSTQAPGGQNEGQAPSTNGPFQFIQNVIGGFVPGQTTKAPEGDSGQSSNPIVSGIQSAGGQVQQFFNQTNLAGALGNNTNFTPPSIENISNQFGEALGNVTPPGNLQEAAQNLAGQVTSSNAGKAAEEIMTASD